MPVSIRTAESDGAAVYSSPLFACLLSAITIAGAADWLMTPKRSDIEVERRYEDKLSLGTENAVVNRYLEIKTRLRL